MTMKIIIKRYFVTHFTKPSSFVTKFDPQRWIQFPHTLPPSCQKSLLVELRTRDREVESSNPGRSGGRFFFFSRLNFVSWFFFGVRSTPVLPQWHIKDPGHSVKSAGGRLHLTTHTPLTQRCWLCHCAGIVWEPIRKRAHAQLIREHSATVVSVCWANLDWSWPKGWN